MVKTVKNESGYVIVAALMILCILTLMGTLSLHTSNTELRIATNHQIYNMNLYAADGGVDGYGPVWLMGKDADGNLINHPPSEYKNVDWVGTFEYGQKNHTFVTGEITHVTKIDPDDGVEKVLLFGDEDGDYLNEDNFEIGLPYVRIKASGTHIRGGETVIERTFKHQPIFADPGAALRVNSSVSGNGVSGSIIGEHRSGSSCPDMPDIMYDLAGGVIDYSGDMGDNPLVSQSTGMYPMPLVKDAILKNSRTTKITPTGPQVDAGDIVSSADNPGLFYISSGTKITNMSGYGILFIDGDYECAGNLDWNGLILVSGNITLSGGGTKIVYGSVVASGEAVAINGSVDIQADCDLLKDLFNDMSYYKKLPTWRFVRG